MSLQLFCSNIFILPKKMLATIESLLTAFLRTGSDRKATDV